jgi:hypothetical protein
MHAAGEILTLRLQAALTAAFGVGYSEWDSQLRAAWYLYRWNTPPRSPRSR